MSEKGNLNNIVVKRRQRGRTPWRRTYSCIEPASLLYAGFQGHPDWDATLNSIRRGEVNASSLFSSKNDAKSDSCTENKSSDRISSARHIMLGNQLSDFRTLQNRDVSVNYLKPEKMLDLESGLKVTNNCKETKKKGYDMAAARRRRHTVSRIEYSSPFLPISEANEDKLDQVKRGSNLGSMSVSRENACHDGRDVEQAMDDRKSANIDEHEESELQTSSCKEFQRREDSAKSVQGKYLQSHERAVDFAEILQHDIGNEVNMERTEDSGKCESTVSSSCSQNNDEENDNVMEGERQDLNESKTSLETHFDDVRTIVMDMINEVVSDNSDYPTCCESEDTKCVDIQKVSNITAVGLFSRRESEPVIQIQSLQKQIYQDENSKIKKTVLVENEVFEGDGFKRLYQLATSTIQRNTKKKPKICDFISSLQGKGIWLCDPRLKKVFQLIEQESERENSQLTEEVFMRICSPSSSFVRNILLSQMTIPGFSLFQTRMTQVFHTLLSSPIFMSKKEIRARDESFDPSSNYLDFMQSRRSHKDRSISMSVCTVDGQRLSYGDNESLHSLDACANILNYCIACSKNGIQSVKSRIGKTGIKAQQSEFTFDADGKVLNPFTKAGSIMTSAFLLQNDVTENRISELHDTYSRIMANEPLCCDNLSYNLKRLYAHEEISLAYFLSAKQKFRRLSAATPSDILELHFQSSSTAATSDSCSVAAATLAAGGKCPLTDEAIFKEEIVLHTLKRVRAGNATKLKKQGKTEGDLCFVSDESGVIFLVVPGVLGLVCFLHSYPKDVVQDITGTLIQNLESTFNFAVYRNLRKRRDGISIRR